MNISRDTKIATVLHFDGCPYSLEAIDEMYKLKEKEKDPKKKSSLSNEYKNMILANAHYIDNVFAKISSPDENAVHLCHQLFGLPDFTEMNELFKEQFGR